MSEKLYKIIKYLSSFYIKITINFVKKKLKRCGSDVEIVFPLDFRGPEYISIGDGSFIGPRSLIGAGIGAEVIIGKNVLVGPEVSIIAGDHRYDIQNVNIRESGVGTNKPIVIDNDVWIGNKSIILKGVHISQGSIVGAGSVVTKNIGKNEIWAGNPAKFIKKRFKDDFNQKTNQEFC